MLSSRSSHACCLCSRAGGWLVLRDGGGWRDGVVLVPGERVMRRGCPSRSTARLACLYWLVLAPANALELLPRTMGVSRTRVRGSLATSAACRRRLRVAP